MEKIPYTFGMGTTFFLSQIHIRQAIVRTEENNIRTIAAILGVTQSAASQTFSRLTTKRLIDEKRAFLARIFSAFKSVYNERLLELTLHKVIQGPSIQDPCVQGPPA